MILSIGLLVNSLPRVPKEPTGIIIVPSVKAVLVVQASSYDLKGDVLS